MTTLALLYFRIQSYISYLWNARGNHYLHSPFVFEWYKTVKNYTVKCPPLIQLYRDDLAKNLDAFEYNSNQNKTSTTISQRYKQTSINHQYGAVLHATAQYLNAKKFLELGTSLGVSTLYMTIANEGIKGISIDANSQAIDIAMTKFKDYGLDSDVSFYLGEFKNALPQILSTNNLIDICYIDGDHSYDATVYNTKYILPYLSPHSVIILDDIRWSRDMFLAWEELISIDPFNITVDFGRIGLLFKLNNSSPKQHFVLR